LEILEEPFLASSPPCGTRCGLGSLRLGNLPRFDWRVDDSHPKMRLMPQAKLARNLLFGGLGLVAGFLALAVAVPLEPQVPLPLLVLLSPGLKIAELIMPQTHGSLAWTFGWFLRIAILGNAVFYYAIFALLAHLLARRGTS
jgi:hypothetical protein